MITMVRRYLVVLAAAGVLMAASEQPARSQSAGPGTIPRADWPMNGGSPQQTWFNPDEGRIDARNVSSLQLAWSRSFGCTVYANPVVVDGVLYTGEYCSYVRALDAVTGQTLWSTNVGGITVGPAVVDGTVYVGSRHTPWAYALDASSGSIIWSTPLGSIAPNGVTVVGSVAYVGCLSGEIHALEASTGAKIWTTQAGAPSGGIGIPAFAEGIVYVISDNGEWLHAIDGRTGAVHWSFDLDPGSGGYAAFTVSVAGGMVYVGGDRVRALDARTGAVVWSSLPGTSGRSQAIGYDRTSRTICSSSWDGRLTAFDAITGQVLWTVAVGQHGGTPCVANGVVYELEWPGPSNLHAFHAVSGQLLWSHPLGASTQYNPQGSGVTVVNGFVYVPVTWGYRIDAYRLP